MAPTGRKPLIKAENGLTSPLYFDRQVVQAEDLTLDRASHDRELARMRRYLHGWGVVAGLVPHIEADILTVTGGYGVTPLGREVFFAGALSVAGIAAQGTACCGPGGSGCALVDEAAIAAAAVTLPVLSWLIARPTLAETDLRPGVDEGCAHPANHLRPSRSCGGVALDLICALPESHRVAASLPGHLCGAYDPLSPDMHSMRPMPPEVSEEDDFVVLGQVLVEDGVAVFRTADRRTLLPTAVLQEWLMTSTCPSIFYVNRNPQEGGEHEVHRLGCRGFVPDEQNRLYLGFFTRCEDAVRAAAAHFGEVDGCRNCLPDCHFR